MSGKKELNMAIGANIKRERENAHMTQEHLSELIGIGVKSLSAIERGAVGISLSTLIKLCRILGVSSDALLFGRTQGNDVSDMADRLARISSREFEITKKVFANLLEAFNMEKGD